MLRLTWFSFLVLVILGHLGFFYILFAGTQGQILSVFALFIFECMFCSTAIYHRLLSHRSWNAPRWIEVTGTFFGIFTFTGSSITRTLSHRYHHQYSDTEKDPHSPKIMGIFKTYFPMLDKDRKMDLRVVQDLMKDPFHRWSHKHYLHIIIGAFAFCYISFGFKWAVALTIAPAALSWMNISICNIFCHPGQNEKEIRNSFLLALITFGEGWHYNHHKEPDNPNFGDSRLDIGYLAVKIMRKI